MSNDLPPAKCESGVLARWSNTRPPLPSFHSHKSHFLAMPPKPKEKPPTKKWGAADRAALRTLINEGIIEMDNLSVAYINGVWDKHFSHQDPRNFCRNFCNFVAAYLLELEFEGARRIQEEGKLFAFDCCINIHY